MRLRVEKPALLQLFERECTEHRTHHTAIGSARKVGQPGAAHRFRINPAPRQIADALHLLLSAANFQKTLSDSGHALRTERRCFLLRFQWFAVGRGAKGQRWLPAGADSQLRRQLTHGLRKRDAAHQLVKANRVAAFIARKAMKESALQINGKTRMTFAAMCVCGDWTEGLHARAC